ncbi:hypothetical protein D3C78_1958650 [compost metagenome]
MQAGIGPHGEIVPVAEDADLQQAVLDVVTAGIDGREEGAAHPGAGALGHQYGAVGLAQQLPVLGGEQGLL